MKKIPLRKKYVKRLGQQYALVDDEDYEKIKQFNWTIKKVAYNNYVAIRPFVNEWGDKSSIAMHHEIIKVPKGKHIRHINDNKLDNRKCNLEIVTKSESQMSRKKRKETTSKYKGVSWSHKKKKWIASISLLMGTKNLGTFNNPVDAAIAYDDAAREYFEKCANTNFKNWDEEVEARKIYEERRKKFKEELKDIDEMFDRLEKEELSDLDW